MRIICTTSSTNQYLDGLEFAVVEVTPDLLARVRARAEIARAARAADPEFLEAYFWDGAATYYAAGEWSEDEHVDGAASEDDEARTECEQMVVHVCVATGAVFVSWMALPKHGDDYVTTPQISLDELEGLRGAT